MSDPRPRSPDILACLAEATVPPSEHREPGARRRRRPPIPSTIPPIQAFEFDQHLKLVAVTVEAHPSATPGKLVPVPASLPARGRLGVGAGAKVPPLRAPQRVATAIRRLTRPIASSTLRPVRKTWLSVDELLCRRVIEVVVDASQGEQAI